MGKVDKMIGSEELKIIMEEDFNNTSINKRLQLFTVKNDITNVDGIGSSTETRLKLSVRDRINSLMHASAKNRTAYSKRKILSDTVNDMYSKIDTLLRNDIKNRKIHAKDIVEGSYMFLQIYWKKKKKEFNFQYMELYLDMESIANRIDHAMNSIQDLKNDDYRPLESVKAEIFQMFDENYWYILDTELIVKSSGVLKGELETHIITTKNQADSVYATLVNIANINSMENKYVLLLKKQYDELEYSYGKDPKAMKIIDEIFNRCITHTEAAMQYNYNSSVHLTQFMQHYVNQMTKFYEIVRS